MIKRTVTIILAVLSVLSLFTACSKKAECALSVGGADVSNGIYTYYLDLVLSDPASYGVKAESYETDVKSAVEKLIKGYVAVNTLSSSLGLPLPYSLKEEAAQETESRWDVFSGHYEKIGITKPDLYKTVANSAYKTALLEYFYGTKGKEKKISEKNLKKEFEKQYIGVKIVASPLTTTDNLGNTVTVDSYELSNIRQAFSSMKKNANNGTDIEKLYTQYNTSKDLIGTESLSTYVFTRDSAEYGEDFFKTISSLKYNKADVIEYEDTIYLVYRVDITGEEYNYYYIHRLDVLKSLRMGLLDKMLEKESSRYEVKERSSVASDIYSKVSALYAEK